MKQSQLLFLWLLLLSSGCGIDSQLPLFISDQTPTVSPSYWRRVFSIGPKVDRNDTVLDETGYAASICESGQACIRIDWQPITTAESESPRQYAVFRRKIGENYNYEIPLGTTTNSYYIDTSNDLATTYYYQVGWDFDGTVYRSSEILPEIMVFKPDANQAFVHRWMVNKVNCEQIDRGFSATAGIDVDNNYRCPFNGLGSQLDGDVRYLDFSKHMIVDRFEVGCGYSVSVCSAHDPGDSTSTTDCVGDTAPTGLTAPLNSVFYQRGGRRCYINTDGGTTWVDYNSASSSQRLLMESPRAHEPPLFRMSQQTAAAACDQRQVLRDGSWQSMGLPRRSEFVAFTFWDPEYSDSEIEAIEAGGSTNGYCNTDSGHGLTWDNTYPPSDDDFFGGSSGTPTFISGSAKTDLCVSQFGVQDAVGNLYEWASDQIQNNTGITSLADSTNEEWNGLDFSGQVGPSGAFNQPLTTFPFLNTYWGLPLQCSAISPDPQPACAADDTLIPMTSDLAHGDRFFFSANGTPRGALVGGLWADGTGAGRLRFALDQGWTNTFPSAGLRCLSRF